MLRPEVRPHDISSGKRVEAPRLQHWQLRVRNPGTRENFRITTESGETRVFCPGTVVAPSRITTYANSIATRWPAVISEALDPSLQFGHQGFPSCGCSGYPLHMQVSVTERHLTQRQRARGGVFPVATYVCTV